jgi:hypothetical protein
VTQPEDLEPLPRTLPKEVVNSRSDWHTKAETPPATPKVALMVGFPFVYLSMTTESLKDSSFLTINELLKICLGNHIARLPSFQT